MTHNRMHTVKIVHASQAFSIYKFMNTTLELLNCNANIYFNRTCLEQNWIPQYAHIKLYSHNKFLIKHTKSKIAKIGIKNEIKFL
jgi:hypothetical protein